MLFVVSGKVGSGKNTFSEFLAKHLDDNYILAGAGDFVKNNLQRDFDLVYEQLWGDKKEEQDKRYPKPNGGFWTPRELMQTYATDWFRSVDKDYWVKQLFKMIDHNEYKNVIIYDGRFKNEIDYYKERGAVHIRVYRDGAGSKINPNHSSETSIEDYRIDIKIFNNGTLEDLDRKAKVTAESIMNGTTIMEV